MFFCVSFVCIALCVVCCMLLVRDVRVLHCWLRVRLICVLCVDVLVFVSLWLVLCFVWLCRLRVLYFLPCVRLMCACVCMCFVVCVSQ